MHAESHSPALGLYSPVPQGVQSPSKSAPQRVRTAPPGHGSQSVQLAFQWPETFLNLACAHAKHSPALAPPQPVSTVPGLHDSHAVHGVFQSGQEPVPLPKPGRRR